MVKKAIQRQRTMTYFIDAAKDIIKEEGVNAVTARKVGERSGYSYATIYNYFNDLDRLLLYCAFDFLEDCYKYMVHLEVKAENSKEKFIEYASAYFKYFAERPDLFDLIFVKNLGEVPEEFLREEKKPSVALLLRQCLVDCAKDGYITEDEVDVLGELLIASIHGKLLFYLTGRHEYNLDEILSMVEMEGRFVIENKGGRQ